MLQAVRGLAKAQVELWRLLVRARVPAQRVLGAFVVLMVSGLFEAAGIGMLVPLLQVLTEPAEAVPTGFVRYVVQALPGHSRDFYVFLLSAVVLTTIIFKNILAYVGIVLASKLRERAAINLRTDLFARILGSQPEALEHSSSSDVANAFLSDANRSLRAVDFSITLAQRGTITLGYVAAILWISWDLTLLTGLLGVVVGLTGYSLARRIRRAGQAFVAASSALARRFTEAYNGRFVIHASATEALEQAAFGAPSRQHAQSESISAQATGALTAVNETVGVAGAMVLVVLADRYFLANGTLDVAQFLAFGFGLVRLLPALNQVYGIQASILGLTPAIVATQRWLDLPQYPRRPFGPRPFSRLVRGIRFDAVGYGFSPDKLLFNDLSFEIAAGEMVALVGPSGCGKTTLSSLLLRLREPSSGRILFDGVDHWEFDRATFARAVAWVGQDPFIFQASVLRNVTYGVPEAMVDDAWAALATVDLDEFVRQLPNGLETEIGERGTTLSGGQRQRLAIARALVRKPQILVLDEPTSALDPETERQVVDAIEAASVGRTTLVIAHRMSTIARASSIVTLAQGRIGSIEYRDQNARATR